MATSGKTMRKTPTDAAGAFFDQLAKRGHEPLLATTSGTLRFDLVEGRRVDHWHVTLSKGDVTVSHKNVGADAVVRTDRALFDGMVTGRVNAMAATLRGVLVPQGDLGLILMFQRLFPGPPRSRRTAKSAEKGRKR
jgi:hypothetical protein